MELSLHAPCCSRDILIAYNMFASVVGMLIAALPAVRHGALFYRAIEHDKNAA